MVPIVVSVPKQTTCLSGVVINPNLVAVGAPLTAVALFEDVIPPDVSHVYNFPSCCHASKSSPKLANVH